MRFLVMLLVTKSNAFYVLIGAVPKKVPSGDFYQFPVNLRRLAFTFFVHQRLI